MELNTLLARKSGLTDRESNIGASPETCSHVCSSIGDRMSSAIGISMTGPTEALKILNDVRAALERDLESARVQALRLVTFLTAPNTVDHKIARGGLVPWQKRKIDRYLRERLEYPILVETLAQQIPLSVSHFCRAFKITFGETPHVHIIRLRLKLAQKLMLSTKMPLCEIALACGLADQAHLSKIFRRWLNESPGAWRRRNLTDAQAETRLSSAGTQVLERGLITALAGPSDSGAVRVEDNNVSASDLAAPCGHCLVRGSG